MGIINSLEPTDVAPASIAIKADIARLPTQVGVSLDAF